ncbi:MAG: SDR family oxidoreductase, partial [Actinomycetota bacterium]|nr:SDR family oxidoreductase [Actinomycetota bacterium]
VVTGASAGVGRATASAFAGAGYDVALLARGRAGLEAAAEDVECAGGKPLVVPTDVASFEAVDAAATRVEDELGPIDVWVNNAMTTVFAPVADTEAREFKRATEVTYLGQVWGTMVALERMRPRDRGRIVNVGSALAFVGIPLQAAYCGAKFACRGFTESIRAELLAEGSSVTVSMVHLPALNTPQFDWCLNKLPKRPQPVPPIYQPEVAAQAILQAANDGRPAAHVGSWNRVVVAGSKLMPSVLAHYLARTAVSGQQTDAAADPDRVADLFAPVDNKRDHGAHGRFGDRANGIVDADFLASLPQTLRELGAAMQDTVREKLARLRRR